MDSKIIANKQTTRPDPRPVTAKEEDPRDRAARRAAEIRGHLGSMDDGVDEFAAPEPPPGWSYEWKRKLTLGAEEPSHMVALTRMGWEPVPASRHPEMMPSGGNYVHIERKGMILMERPRELVDEAREIERRRAIGQVRAKEAQIAGTPDGTMTRDDPRVAPKIKKAYEAMPIPKE
jgi:hypothetical protein